MDRSTKIRAGTAGAALIVLLAGVYWLLRPGDAYPIRMQMDASSLSSAPAVTVKMAGVTIEPLADPTELKPGVHQFLPGETVDVHFQISAPDCERMGFPLGNIRRIRIYSYRNKSFNERASLRFQLVGQRTGWAGTIVYQGATTYVTLDETSKETRRS